MKIAVVHEWLIDWAGSERVLQQILSCFPDADLFALVDFLPPAHRHKVLNKHASTTFLQRMPFAKSHLALYLPLLPIAIEQLDLSNYDLIISSSHAVSKGVITGPDQMHISYVYSPMRYAWDLQHEYLHGSNGRGLKGFVLRWVLHYLRLWDSRTANGVDAFIADSKFIARRIHKVYRRDAHVIYPPVDLERFAVRFDKENFYLCAGRLEPYKRVNVVVDAFAKMPGKKLVVIGSGPELSSLKKSAPSNVEFLGYQPDAVVQDYMSRAKALIFSAKEDFGIVPLEAQASGTPVIAYGRGGATETVIPFGSPDPTGVFFQEQSVTAVLSAIELFEQNIAVFVATNCRKNAERFSSQQFQQQLNDFITTSLQAASS